MKKTVKGLLPVLFPYALLIYSYVFFDAYQLPKSIALFILVSPALFIMFFTGFRIKTNPETLAVLLFILYSSVSIFLSVYNIPPQYYAVYFAPSLFFIFSISRRYTKKLLFTFNISSLISSVFGIYQFAKGISRPYSFFGNPIFFSEFLMSLLPFLAVSMYIFKTHRTVIAANIVLSLFMIFAASSRGVFVSLFISMALFAAVLHNLRALSGVIKPDKKVIITSLILISLLLFIPGTVKKISYNTKRAANILNLSETAIQNRIVLMKSAADIIKNHPFFGSGPGSFRYFHQKEMAAHLTSQKELDFVYSSYVHNDYLQTAVERGFAGLLLFLASVFLLFYKFEKCYRKIRKERSLIASAALISLFSLLIESFFNFPLHILPGAALFWIIAGILYNYISDEKKHDKPHDFTLPVIALLFCISLFFLYKTCSNAVSDIYLRAAASAAPEKKYSKQNYLKKALKVSPGSFMANYMMADYFINISKPSEAIKYYNKCLDIEPHSADILFNIGAIHFSMNNYSYAEKYLNKALEYYPGFPRANYILGKTYLKMNKPDEADVNFQSAFRKDPDIARKIPGNFEWQLIEMTSPGQ